ncbi:signal peptidase I [candidate division KSB3 bacterium]|uniref:Signal peptidase I n=1 Tax=candidate division KSB3 bacterium TaxID=2044937 RepID=A0A9D5Q7W5_9BACT|nr:signal peptidase I [candidate division KSB3 bacterium]MBD3326727.1 signal peptidase I [candidate division KSB3 bacterium]
MKKSERLTLTEQSLAKLRRENIPVDILTELEDLKDLEYESIKKFLRTIEKKIGKDRTAQYKTVILQQTEHIEHGGKSVLREYVEAFVIAIVLAFVIRMFVVEAFKIPSGSMIPTLLIGDHLLVNKFIYKFTEPQREDVIVFKYPDDPSRNFIKRIIGVGGDTIEIQDKVVYLNGTPQQEPYVQHVSPEILPARYSPRDNFGPITVPPNGYFMMGDNRDSSLDSRFWENRFVNRRDIVGKAFIIYWSWKHDENTMPETEEAFADRLIRHVTTIGYYLVHFPSVVRWNRLAHLIR